MKRSEYREKRIVHHEQAMGYYCRGGASAEGRTAVLRADLDIEAAEAAGVTWDPEEPEGFREWWAGGRSTHQWVRDECLAAWSACLAHQQTSPDSTKKSWWGDMTFEEIDRAITQGVAPGSRDSGGFIVVPNGYMAWKGRQKAQVRPIEPRVDPEVRRKEIKAQIEAWAFEGWGPPSMKTAGRTLLQRLGVL